MTKLNDNLSDILDIETVEEFELLDDEDILPDVVENVEDMLPDAIENAVEKDTEYARTNIKNLIKEGNNAIKNLLKVAKESQAPRAYEVVATLLKNIADLNKDLLELQKRKKDLSPNQFKNQNISVDKAIVFTGSTTELITLIKQQKDS